MKRRKRTAQPRPARSPSHQRPHAQIGQRRTADLIAAMRQGFLWIIRQRDPKLAERVERWLADLLFENTLREARHGKAEAYAWLLSQLRVPQLPDLRSEKSLLDDLRDIVRYKELKEKLAPIFEGCKYRRVERRNRAAAPIVSRVLGHSISPEQLPTDAVTLSEFCFSLLGRNPVRLSRARRRSRKVIRQRIEFARELVERAASSGEIPSLAGGSPSKALTALFGVLPGLRFLKK